MNGKARLDKSQRLTDAEQVIFQEYITADCQWSFKEWLPQSHDDWDYFVEFESYIVANCKKTYQSGRYDAASKDELEILKLHGAWMIHSNHFTH